MRGRRKFDLQRLNPDWNFAKKHGKASKSGYIVTNEKLTSSIIMCPCCLNIIDKEPVSLWENTKELSFLGYGFPLFYNMILYCLISLIILILSESAILMYLAILECDDPNSGISDYKCKGAFTKIARVDR